MTSSISVHDGGRVSAVENGEIQSKSCNADDTTPQSWADIVRSKFLGSDPRSCAGVCMLAFAVPLLIPGITLTVVVFEDEKGFSKFSALHIIGMILLTVSILLTIAGLVLSIHCRSKVSPDDGPQNVSTHEKLKQDFTISQRFDSHGSYKPHHYIEDDTPLKIPLPASYVVSQGISTAADDMGGIAGKSDVGSRPPASLNGIHSAPETLAQVMRGGFLEPERQCGAEDLVDCYSSSSGSLDSDVSSASYSIHESADEAEIGTPFNEKTKFKSPRSGQKTFDWDLATSVPGSSNMPCPFPLINPSNFDLKSKNFFDWCANEKDLQTAAAATTVSKDAQESEDVNKATSGDTADDAECPTLRQRLYAVSGELSRPSSDGVVRPPFRNSGHSEDQNSSMSESNSSVFPADSTTKLTNEIRFEPAPLTSESSAPADERHGDVVMGDLPYRHHGISNCPKRPQSDGLVRQIHFSDRPGAKSWPENLFPMAKDGFRINLSNAVSHLAETAVHNSIALNESLVESRVIKLSNEVIDCQPVLNAQYSNGADVTNENTLHSDILHDRVCKTASNNEQDIQTTQVVSYKTIESNGVVSHDKSTNSDLYTASLGVFSS